LQGTILIVDDDSSVLRLLGAHLSFHRWTVHTLETVVGLEAAIRTWRPDVVLCDLCLPDRDAIEFLVARSACGVGDPVCDTPIVMMSAQDLVQDAVDIDMDVAGVIRKPLDLSSINDLIESAINLDRKAATP